MFGLVSKFGALMVSQFGEDWKRVCLLGVFLGLCIVIILGAAGTQFRTP